MDQTLIQKVIDHLGNYIKEYSIYTPTIVPKFTGSIDPTVVIQCISNTAISVLDPHSLVIFEIDIYAKNKEVNGTMVLDVTICKEIEHWTDIFMSKGLGFKRIKDEPVEEEDLTLYHMKMQFSATVSDSRCHFF